MLVLLLIRATPCLNFLPCLMPLRRWMCTATSRSSVLGPTSGVVMMSTMILSVWMLILNARSLASSWMVVQFGIMEKWMPMWELIRQRLRELVRLLVDHGYSNGPITTPLSIAMLVLRCVARLPLEATRPTLAHPQTAKFVTLTLLPPIVRPESVTVTVFTAKTKRMMSIVRLLHGALTVAQFRVP